MNFEAIFFATRNKTKNECYIKKMENACELIGYLISHKTVVWQQIKEFLDKSISPIMNQIHHNKYLNTSS